MVEVLVEAIRKGVEEKLGAEFCVYTESVYQNAEKPCIFIECENAECKKLLSERFFVRAFIKISIVTDSETKNYDTQKLMGEMFSLLSFVRTDSLTLEGRRLQAKWEGDNLVFCGQYDLFGTENTTDEKDYMEKLEGGCYI